MLFKNYDNVMTLDKIQICNVYLRYLAKTFVSIKKFENSRTFSVVRAMTLGEKKIQIKCYVEDQSGKAMVEYII